MPDAPLSFDVPPATDGLPAFVVVLAVVGGAVLTALTAARLLRLDEVLRTGAAPARVGTASIISQIRLLAEQAKRDGLASLSKVADRIRDPFLRRALRLAVSAGDPGELAARLEHQLDHGLAARMRRSRLLWPLAKAIAALGPLTLLTAIALMIRVGTDPGAMSPVSAAALLCITLLAMALIALLMPAGAERLPAADEFLGRTLIVAGLVAIREGQPSAAVEARLISMLPPALDPAVRVAA